ncbi:Shikimate dehydrogenase (NADP(+)) [Candidatus Vidania fulgoroideae]|nr:Shikimate dehydrogenase (NADP(+)) [Candidatus Vidania fulgoroideae]
MISLIGKNVRKSLTNKIYDFLFKKSKQKLFFRGFSVRKNFLLKKILLILFKKNKLLNITIPYKEEAFFFANYICKNSSLFNSINCIFLYKNCTIGFNTDGIGFLKDFKKKFFIKKKPNILVLGMGGAFKGIINFIKKIKHKNIFLDNRKKKKIIMFIKKEKYLKVYKNEKFKILINTVPTQFLFNFIKNKKIPIKKKTLCYDIGYLNKTKVSYLTNFFFNGTGMLLFQAIENFKILLKIQNERITRIS